MSLDLTEIRFNQIGWQTHIFDVDVGGTPTAGLGDDLRVDKGGVFLINTPKDVEGQPGKYSILFEPYEIRDPTETSFTLIYSYYGTDPNVNVPNPRDLNVTDPALLNTDTPQYCTVYELYTRFGYDNVNKWADMGNVQDINQISQKIIDEIVVASRNTDGRLRYRYNDIPFSDPYPNQVMNLTRLEAGVNLHDARGIEDTDNTLQPARNEAENLIRQIASGVLILDRQAARQYGSIS